MLTMNKQRTRNSNWHLCRANKILDIPAGGVRVETKASDVVKCCARVFYQEIATDRSAVMGVIILVIAGNLIATHD